MIHFQTISYVLIVFVSIISEFSCYNKCNQRLLIGDLRRAPGDNGFSIEIKGYPAKYNPKETYSIILKGPKELSGNRVKFTNFSLLVEPSQSNSLFGFHQAGIFQLLRGDVLIKFSEDCPNMVTHTSLVAKPEIEVLWIAPPSGSGCVTFRAIVVDSTNDVWHMDDGKLTKELCEDVQVDDNVLPPVLDECCACDEAKYQVTFEGLWSKHTHPKDFPTNEWLTHFSDIIGASHDVNFKVWEANTIASDGLRQVAEWGATRKLESELKAKSKHIRTIIKSRGLWYPNVNGKTLAVFRVDRKHHLMSLVSMLGPSPDWFVGLPSLELCTKNCSWIESKTIDLYPWDAGTDNGITYMSPNFAAVPRQKITRITNTWPDDARSPFYDPTGAPVRPVARVVISKQRIYEKSCSEESSSAPLPSYEVEQSENSEDSLRPECAVTAWGAFSPCNVPCGKGLRMRQRSYVLPFKAKMMACNRQLVEKEMCVADSPECGFSGEETDSVDVPGDLCNVTGWSSWSECSSTCGKGVRSRSRQYVNRMSRKFCEIPLQEKEMCENPVPCEQEYTEEEVSVPKNCQITPWSEWSPCSATCGNGFQVRTRMYYDKEAAADHGCNLELTQKKMCAGERPTCRLSEEESLAVGRTRHAPPLNHRALPTRGDPKIPLLEAELVRQFCPAHLRYPGSSHHLLVLREGREENFMQFSFSSPSSSPSSSPLFSAAETPAQHEGEHLEDEETCRLEKNVGACRGYFRRWFFDVAKGQCQPFIYGGCRGNGNNFHTYEECRKTCQRLEDAVSVGHAQGCPLTPVDCVVSRWSAWSSCSVTCGEGYKTKTRIIKVHPRDGGVPCPVKMQRRQRCENPPCSAF